MNALSDRHESTHSVSHRYIADDRRRVDYPEFDREVNACVAAFTQVFKQGDRVAMLLPAGVDFAVLMHALLRYGAVPVILDYHAVDATVQTLLAGEVCVITDTPMAVRLRTRWAPLPAATAVCPPFHLLLSRAADVARDLEPTAAKDCAIVMQSSGTTGVPKKIQLSASNLAWATAEYAEIYDFQNNPVILNCLPSHYSLGLFACFLSAIYHRATVVITNDVSSVEGLIDKHQINIIPASPVIYEQIVRLELDSAKAESLRLLDSGGSYLSKATIVKLRSQLGICITEGYGLTETSSLTHFLQHEADGRIVIGSVGKARPSVVAKIVKSDGECADVLDIGELCIKGPMVFLQYDDQAETERAFAEGWFKTGDLFYRDEDGYYFFVARAKDLGGIALTPDHMRNIHDIEEFLVAHAAVEDFGIDLQPDLTANVFVKLNEEVSRSLEIAELNAILNLSGFTLGLLRIVDSIPRTSSGKLKKRLLSQTVP